MDTGTITRGKLAKLARVNAETVRYYEKQGLMPEPPRSQGGHRVYGPSHVKRLAFIRRCRELGFNLGEIRGLLKLVDGGTLTCGEVLARTNEHIADIQAKIRDLEEMERSLTRMASQCSGKAIPDCPIVEKLWNP
ncbi:MAG: helix-turn-helix domain-containing protein [Xanthomonadales bacterium]|nr:helix-turn-helix domain-containing protein [Xanthomonadales bacterium]